MLSTQQVTNEKPQDKVAAKSQGREKINNGNSTTLAEQKAREELNGSKPRYEKGMELYKQGKVSITGDGLFKVSGFYKVDTGKMQCECPDYKNNRRPCKHLFACLLFVKNRGKQSIENLEGFSNGANGKESISQSESKDASSKPVEGRKEHDRQSTITRLAVLNTATEILKTHRKPIELTEILSLAGELEAWALGN